MDVGKFARLTAANVFTADQTIGNLALGSNAINLAGGALGNGVRGPTLFLQKNTSDNTPAHINFVHAGSPGHTFLWSDDSGVMRVILGYSTEWRTAAGRNSGGTVVGAQTSSLDSKDVIGAPIAIDEVLAAVAVGARRCGDLRTSRAPSMVRSSLAS